jgi:hypothetical protein
LKNKKKIIFFYFNAIQMPENRQVLKNAASNPSGDNIEGDD